MREEENAGKGHAKEERVRVGSRVDSFLVCYSTVCALLTSLTYTSLSFALILSL